MWIHLRLRRVGWLIGLTFTLAACTISPGGADRDGRPPIGPITRIAPIATVETEQSRATAVPPTSPPPSPAMLPAAEPPPGAAREFSTDFTIHTIPYSEIFSGGPPKDGIPAIDNPTFISTAAAGAWLDDLEPVILFKEQGDVRIYPFQILTWHEIVNDVVGGRPVVITFCPLCNTAIVFDATVNGQALDFGATGRLRFSNLLMYDRQTESWWQQASGDAVIGELTGARLTFLPATIISWAEAKAQYPQAQVLSRDTGYTRRYGQNPYVGYDNINGSPFLFRGETPDQLPAMARVTTVALQDEVAAYPNQVLQEVGVVNDRVGGTEIVVFWQPGLASALDSSSIAEGQDVGASGVFERVVNGRTLTFIIADGRITDEQTGSVWNIFGQATAGELVGQTLTPVVKVDHFWFSWAAFRPDTRIYQP
ncbi:MAG TPA: DUF3179 domain-containing protein [Chloroflexota bacterium]|nr:DUF3179 domain-containing protein [Chloroflexota bacterium]